MMVADFHSWLELRARGSSAGLFKCRVMLISCELTRTGFSTEIERYHYLCFVYSIHSSLLAKEDKLHNILKTYGSKWCIMEWERISSSYEWIKSKNNYCTPQTLVYFFVFLLQMQAQAKKLKQVPLCPQENSEKK